MSDKTFVLSIITPQRQVFSGPANMVILKTVTGEIGVLPGHIPLVAPLAIGPLRIKIGEKECRAAINGGFIEITGQQVNILAQSAELAEEIDVLRAESARQRAQDRLEKKQADLDHARAQAALQRALVRIQVAAGR